MALHSGCNFQSLCVLAGTVTRGLHQVTFLQEDRLAAEQVARESCAASIMEAFKTRLDKALNKLL